MDNLDDKLLLMEIQRQLLQPQSPQYTKDGFEKISSSNSSNENQEDLEELSESEIRVKEGDNDFSHSDIENDEKMSSESSQSRSRSRTKNQQRWKYCCYQCKKQDKGSIKPKTCVCIVPATQRRIQIGEKGCLTCGCRGCSIEDLQASKKKKEKKEQKRKQVITSSSEESENNDFKVVNGCCKRCMKAFSKNGKSCLCQVPKAVRKKPLPPDGCQYCYCQGCNPEDKKKEKGLSQQQQQQQQVKQITQKAQKLSPLSDEVVEMNLNNFDLARQPFLHGFMSTGCTHRCMALEYHKEPIATYLEKKNLNKITEI